MTLDILASRSAINYTRHELLLRVLWSLVWPLFRFSPRLCWNWRVFLLRLFGSKIGKSVRIFPSVRVFAPWNLSVGDETSIGFDVLIYNLGPLSIGDRVTVSQRVHLCGGSHMYTNPAMPLIKQPIHIENEVWVCADAFIGPNVTIGEGSVIAARSVVIKDIPPWKVVAGNPAKVLKDRVICQNK